MHSLDECMDGHMYDFESMYLYLSFLRNYARIPP